MLTETETLERLLYRDGLMLVLNKPAGLPVHAGSKGGSTVEDAFPFLQFGLPQPPHLAHRLDRDTSGCLILGRHRKALRKLGKLFEAGRIEKTYWAIVCGSPPTLSGAIHAPLTKKSRDKRSWWMTVDHENGQPASTSYRVIATLSDNRTFVEFHPKTGRTHQIRVHAQTLGCPLWGDPVYGYQPETAAAPMALHARAVCIPLYANRPAIMVTAPLPPHMEQLKQYI